MMKLPLDSISLAIVGAGPVGLALALQAARALPRAKVSLFDIRSVDHDISTDPRTMALSNGSVQLLQRLGLWHASAAQPILEVHVSQQAPTLGGISSSWLGEPEVRISASQEHVPMLGAVMSYGDLVAPLQSAWLAACTKEPERLKSHFETPVRALTNIDNEVELDTGQTTRFSLGVVAEGGVFAEQARKSLAHEYRQTAWVGTVKQENPRPGVAYERFTRHGPTALLPLKGGRAAFVWCVPSDDDPVAGLNDAQRLCVLNSLFHPEVGQLTEMSPLKSFALGLNAERTMTNGRIVRIGNAAQTLHPVAGQGMNLGLRDSVDLIRVLRRNQDIDTSLRRLEWQRGPDRWLMIAATDFLARSFTWKLPGASVARGLALATLQRLNPVKSALARQMMYGVR